MLAIQTVLVQAQTSELAADAESEAEIIKKPGKRIMICGGSANEKKSKLDITFAFGVDVAHDTKDKTLGFRLVQPG